MNKELFDLDTFKLQNLENSYEVFNYNSINLSEIKVYLNSLDKNYFVWLKLNEGDTIEKVLHDYYANEDLYDLILLLNDRDMLFGMPYSYDVILNAINNDIQNYEYKVFGNIKNGLSEIATSKLKEKLDNEYSENNQKYLYLKVIKLDYINEVRKTVADIIETQKDMYSLLDEE